MDFKTSKTSSPWSSAHQRHLRRSTLRIDGAGADRQTNGPLQMYLLPPTGNVSLEEFDRLAVERLQVLRSFERADQSGKQKYSHEWTSSILAELKRLKLVTYTQLLDPRDDASPDVLSECSRRDHVAHFILRLAYCRTEELRTWFIQHELQMFRMRFAAQKSMDSSISEFLSENGIHVTRVSDEQRDSLRDQLREATRGIGAGVLDVTEFFSAPFTDALELVRGRRVLVRAGLVYLPARDLAVVAAARFRVHLQHALALARRLLPVVEQDSRLRSLLLDFDKQYTGRDYSNQSTDAAAVTPDMLDQLAAASFPPCMRQLHERLRATHKLLHGGRMQYGLFLKAIGLSLQDAITFWRQEFTQVMDSDKFQKQYLYNIRHNYGQEGKRTSYTAHTCSKVIGAGSNDAGCPFKHSDRDHLVKMITACGINKDGVTEVCDIAGRQQPQLACQRFWELSHGGVQFQAGAIMHPNQYYDESRKQLTGGSSKRAGLDASKFIRATVASRDDSLCSQSTPTATSNSANDMWDDSLSPGDLDLALATTSS